MHLRRKIFTWTMTSFTLTTKTTSYCSFQFSVSLPVERLSRCSPWSLALRYRAPLHNVTALLSVFPMSPPPYDWPPLQDHWMRFMTFFVDNPRLLPQWATHRSCSNHWASRLLCKPSITPIHIPWHPTIFVGTFDRLLHHHNLVLPPVKMNHHSQILPTFPAFPPPWTTAIVLRHQQYPLRPNDHVFLVPPKPKPSPAPQHRPRHPPDAKNFMKTGTLGNHGRKNNLST